MLFESNASRHLRCTNSLHERQLYLAHQKNSPHEVARLRWGDVDLEGKRVNIAPQHSKTGGARPVTLLRPALHLLRAGGHRPAPQRICPPQWQRHWREVRCRAGWNRLTRPWPQDVCRHSFASYHAARFRNLHELQLQMGHHSTDLLRTRYLNLPRVEQATRIGTGFDWYKEQETTDKVKNASWGNV